MTPEEIKKVSEGNKKFIGANLRYADLRNANLRGADLRNANLRGADLRNAYLWGAYLQGAYLRGAYLQGANLRGANLRNANLRGADLRYADLRNANLRNASLWGAYLRNANLRYADLRNANLRGADLRNANLQGAKIKLLFFPSIRFVSMIDWSELPDNLTIELMRRDAYGHPFPERFDKWKKGGKCPYKNEERMWFFLEDKKLWRKGKPQMKDRDLIVELFKSKGWEICS